jgi:hypothetical protein
LKVNDELIELFRVQSDRNIVKFEARSDLVIKCNIVNFLKYFVCKV